MLVLVNSASTGQTFSQAKECVEYYGGRVSGFAALFSNISELSGKKVVSLFSGADFPHYQTCARQSLPGLCRRHSVGCNRHPESTISCNGQEESVCFLFFMRIEWKIGNGEWKMYAMVSLAFGQFTLCRACRDEMVCVAVWNLTLRIGKEMGRTLCAPTEEKILCRSPFSKRSPVSGLRQTILGKG